MTGAAGNPVRTVADVLAETSIVIGLRDDLRITRCLDSVDEDVEIVIALNGATQAARRAIQQHPRPTVVAEIEEAGNLGAAYNAGIAAASGQYIFLMDSDCLFAPGTIRVMAEAATVHPVVKGQVVYGIAPGPLSRWTARVREFDEGDYVSALSPPLLYDRQIAERIGGYHFDELIHWCEDREFDFRLQLANIRVVSLPSATIHHDAQRGIGGLRSYYRYGIGEGIGQELGIFLTPAVPLAWRVCTDVQILWRCFRDKGPGAAFTYSLLLGAFHVGTFRQLVFDPYRVRRRYPPTVRRVRVLGCTPQHCTELTPAQREALRAAHRREGRVIEPG